MFFSYLLLEWSSGPLPNAISCLVRTISLPISDVLSPLVRVCPSEQFLYLFQMCWARWSWPPSPSCSPLTSPTTSYRSHFILNSQSSVSLIANTKHFIHDSALWKIFIGLTKTASYSIIIYIYVLSQSKKQETVLCDIGGPEIIYVYNAWLFIVVCTVQQKLYNVHIEENSLIVFTLLRKNTPQYKIQVDQAFRIFLKPRCGFEWHSPPKSGVFSPPWNVSKIQFWCCSNLPTESSTSRPFTNREIYIQTTLSRQSSYSTTTENNYLSNKCHFLYI